MRAAVAQRAIDGNTEMRVLNVCLNIEANVINSLRYVVSVGNGMRFSRRGFHSFQP